MFLFRFDVFLQTLSRRPCPLSTFQPRIGLNFPVETPKCTKEVYQSFREPFVAPYIACQVTSTILGDEKSQTEFKLKKGELFANTNGVLEGKIIEFNYIPRSGKRSKFHTLVRRVFTPYGNKVITQKLTDVSKIESLARMATLAGVVSPSIIYFQM
eukprot:jgi/Bigna1/140772/aug1.58_g15480